METPQPRVELGMALCGIATSAIDVSDGLAGDLRHIVERSQVGAVVDYDAIPRSAAFKKIGDVELERECVLSGGDDYELLFTAPAQRRATLEALGRELSLPLTRIGTIEGGETRLVVRDGAGKPVAHRGGYDHFRES